MVIYKHIFLQRRLRHLRSISARNITVQDQSHCKEFGIAFTLHKKLDSPGIFFKIYLDFLMICSIQFINYQQNFCFIQYFLQNEEYFMCKLV